jgi:hypothetical protein
LLIISCCLAYWSSEPVSKFQILANLVTESLFVYYIAITVTVVLYLGGSIVTYKKRLNEDACRMFGEQKENCIGKFFEALGPVMGEEIYLYCKVRTGDGEGKDAKIKTYEAELGKCNYEYGVLKSRHDAYEKLTSDLANFVWCKDCGALGRGIKKIKKKVAGGKARSITSENNLQVRGTTQ